MTGCQRSVFGSFGIAERITRQQEIGRQDLRADLNFPFADDSSETVAPCQWGDSGQKEGRPAKAYAV